MHPRTDEILTHLDHYRTALRNAVAEVPVAQRDARPAPDRWSVAEILEHLGIVEAAITRLLRKYLDAARAAGLGLERGTGPVVPMLDVELVLDRGPRIEANEPVRPTSGLSAAAAWQVLGERRRALRDLVMEVDGLAIGDVGIPHPHPILGLLNPLQWLVFVGAHEGRHAGQIREIAAGSVSP